MGAQKQGVGSQLPPAPTEFNPWWKLIIVRLTEHPAYYCCNPLEHGERFEFWGYRDASCHNAICCCSRVDHEKNNSSSRGCILQWMKNSDVFFYKFEFVLLVWHCPHCWHLNVVETFKVDKNQVSISGLSSGGAMTMQMHVAYSSVFMGAGIITGCKCHDACTYMY